MERTGDKKTCKEIRCSECRGAIEARKVDIAMGGLRYVISGKSGRRMEDNSKR